MKNKEALRKEFLSKRLKLKAEEILGSEAKIIKKIKKKEEFNHAKCICGFYPIHNEPSLIDLYTELLAKKVKIAFPRLKNKHLEACFIDDLGQLKQKPPFGISEPIKACKMAKIDEVEVILVPGLVFDKRGHRIGFGKGYYDNFLKATTALKIGIGFDFQVIDKIPEQEHDIALDMVITPSKIINLHN